MYGLSCASAAVISDSEGGIDFECGRMRKEVAWQSELGCFRKKYACGFVGCGICHQEVLALMEVEGECFCLQVLCISIS